MVSRRDFIKGTLASVTLGLLGNKSTYAQNYNAPLTPGQFIGAISSSYLSYLYEGNIFLYYFLKDCKPGEIQLEYRKHVSGIVPQSLKGSISNSDVELIFTPFVNEYMIQRAQGVIGKKNIDTQFVRNSHSPTIDSATGKYGNEEIELQYIPFVNMNLTYMIKGRIGSDEIELEFSTISGRPAYYKVEGVIGNYHINLEYTQSIVRNLVSSIKGTIGKRTLEIICQPFENAPLIYSMKGVIKDN